MLQEVNVILVTINQHFVFFVMIVGAVEVALGLALIVLVYHKFHTLDSRQLMATKGQS